MIIRLCVIGVSLLPLLAAAGECLKSSLDEGRAKWAAANIESYRITLWESQDAPSIRQSPVRVTVSDGKVVSSRYLHYAFRPNTELEFIITELDEADVAGRDTIPSLFNVVERHLQRTDIDRTCAFHPELGFPMSFGYHYTNRSHGAYGFEVSDFEVFE